MFHKIMWLGCNKVTPEICNFLGISWNPVVFKNNRCWYIKVKEDSYTFGAQETEEEARKVFNCHIKNGCVEVLQDRKIIGGI